MVTSSAISRGLHFDKAEAPNKHAAEFLKKASSRLDSFVSGREAKEKAAARDQSMEADRQESKARAEERHQAYLKKTQAQTDAQVALADQRRSRARPPENPSVTQARVDEARARADREQARTDRERASASTAQSQAEKAASQAAAAKHTERMRTDPEYAQQHAEQEAAAKGHKVCARCKKGKPIDQFGKAGKYRRKNCRSCVNQQGDAK